MAAAGTRPSWMSPKILGLSGAAVVLLVFVIYLNMGGSGGPPMDSPDETRNQLAKWQSLIVSFVVREQRLPSSLDEADQAAKKTDGWGSAMVLTPGTEGPKKTSFTLRSLGKDKQAETPDDWLVTVTFGDDGYGKLGSEVATLVEPQ